ncbi:MAG: hypothetical protein M3441_05535 [Chloroflexota bacterium]|nr:hypothetical protein [Chloroflexota bacterium]
MATVVELRHLCLLLAAGGMVYGKRGAMLPASVRCALYMIVAFALRRGKLGRDLLRGTPSHGQNFSPKDDPSPAPYMRAHDIAERLSVRFSILKDKQGLPYPGCS